MHTHAHTRFSLAGPPQGEVVVVQPVQPAQPVPAQQPVPLQQYPPGTYSAHTVLCSRTLLREKNIAVFVVLVAPVMKFSAHNLFLFGGACRSWELHSFLHKILAEPQKHFPLKVFRYNGNKKTNSIMLPAKCDDFWQANVRVANVSISEVITHTVMMWFVWVWWSLMHLNHLPAEYVYAHSL